MDLPSGRRGSARKHRNRSAPRRPRVWVGERPEKARQQGRKLCCEGSPTGPSRGEARKPVSKSLSMIEVQEGIQEKSFEAAAPELSEQGFSCLSSTPGDMAEEFFRSGATRHQIDAAIRGRTDNDALGPAVEGRQSLLQVGRSQAGDVTAHQYDGAGALPGRHLESMKQALPEGLAPLGKQACIRR